MCVCVCACVSQVALQGAESLSHHFSAWIGEEVATALDAQVRALCVSVCAHVCAHGHGQGTD